MLEGIATPFVIAAISFIPIVLWGYLFAYMDDTPGGNLRFFAGIFGGILAVVPILYIDQISAIVGFPFLNSFQFLSEIGTFLGNLKFSGSLVTMIVFIALFSLLSTTIFHNWLSTSKEYIKNIVLVIGMCFIVVIFLYGIHVLFEWFPGLNINTDSGYSSIFQSTLKFVIFYYIVVGVIEEVSKHFNFLQSSSTIIRNPQNGVLYAIFIALGFSFIENTLYAYNVYTHSGFGEDFIKTFFFRSVFSVIVHVLCSSIVGYYFSRAYIGYKKNNLLFPYMRLFLFGLFVGICLHALFDIGLTLGVSMILIAYFIGGYFYVTGLLYRE